MFTQLLNRPVPLWLGRLPEGHSEQRAPVDAGRLMELDRDFARCEFRAVSVDRVATVLATGIDVEPSDAVIYANDFDKAWEYGHFPKVVLALKALDRTHREVPADTSPAELAAIQERFPTVLPSVDGERLWCSRLPADDPRINTSYEVNHAWWVPGDPLDAQHSVLVFVRHDEDLETVRRNLE